MTRFDATTEDARKELFVDAIRAHGKRDSAFLTIETDADGDRSTANDEAESAPWVQFADGIVNLDCTDAERGSIESVLGEYPEFRIDELSRPEDAEGMNLRITARTDPERVAEFVDRVFREGYDCAADYRAWVTAV